LIYEDNLILFGGVSENGEKFNEIYMMNMSNSKWTLLCPSGNYPSSRTYHNMIIQDRTLFIFGGFSSQILTDCFTLTLASFIDKGAEINNDKRNFCERNQDEKTNALMNSDVNLLINQLKEIKTKYEEEVSKNNCKICFSKEINTLFLDCCHRVVCYDCSFQCSGKCPTCKSTIKSIIKTYG
jgi:hypothetical protein